MGSLSSEDMSLLGRPVSGRGGAGKGGITFPPTAEIERMIREGGYTRWYLLCRDQGWKHSTLSGALRERGDRDYLNRVLEEVRGEANRGATEEAYGVRSCTPAPLASDSAHAQTEELDQLLKYEKSRARRLQSENVRLKGRLNDRWELLAELLEETRDYFSAYGADPEPVGGKLVSQGSEEWVCHAPLADVHVGLLVWGAESWRGKDYDTTLSGGRIKSHGEKVAEWIAEQRGQCVVCHKTDLGDIFHSLTEATVGGTPLQVDGRPLKVWRAALDGEIAAIEALRQVCDKVEIRRVSGNHDGIQADLLSETLAVWYRNAPDVEVFTTNNAQSHFVVGDTLHLLTHGKGVGVLSHKTKASFEVMARETAGDDFAEAKRIKAYFGHLHSPASDTQGRHLELLRLPSLAEPDQYAQSLSFVHNPEARVFRLDEDGDIELERRIRFG